MNCDAAADVPLSLAFSLYSNPGANALLIGAGVSMSAGLPSAWGVLTDLISKVRAVKDGEQTDGDGDAVDAVEWWRTEYDEEPTYQGVLEQLGRAQNDRQALLHNYFEPTPNDSGPSSGRPSVAHHAIARLVRAGHVRVIITLNFDVLIETALREAGVEPVVIATPDDAKGARPLHTMQCCVIHLHGIYTDPTSMLNTFEELDHYDQDRNELLARVLHDYGLIIAGWSATYDPVLRNAISAAELGGLLPIWCEPGRPTDEASTLLVAKRGTLVTATADDFFGQLADAVDALKTTRARQPLTLEVAVETAKRELSGLPVAINLHDRLQAEFDRLLQLPDFSPPYDGAESFGDVRRRIAEASRVCTALTAVLAYWGDETTDRWWLDQLPQFAVIDVRESGDTRRIRAREITATMLFYAAGIGAVASRRYDLLYRLFGMTRRPFVGAYDKRETVAKELVPGREATPTPTQMRELLDPDLRQALGVGEDALLQWWQEFEVLRLTFLMTQHPQFADGLIMESDERSTWAALDSDEATPARAKAWQDWQRALGTLARLVSPGPIHVFTKDTFGEMGWRAPIADDLAEIVLTQPNNPLTRSELVDKPEDFATALTAVSIALGQQGDRWADDHIQETFPGSSSVRAGVVPPECWLDQDWIDTGQ